MRRAMITIALVVLIASVIGVGWATAVSVQPSAAVPALTGWGLWALAGLLLVAILARTLQGRKSALSKEA